VEQTQTDVIIEVSDSTFQSAVLQRSAHVPVVVDFWAPWCGPCRVLGPVLERLAREAKGAFILAKINVDNNPRTAQQYGVQGIPAVKAFRQGRVVGEFVGAQPEPRVREFLRRLAPSAADGFVVEGFRLEQQGRLDEAIARYRQATAAESGHAGALLGLGRTLLAQGDGQEAAHWLEQVPYGRPEREEAERLLARVQLKQGANGTDEGRCRDRLAANPQDLEARLSLGSLLAAREEYETALTELLEVVRNDRGKLREKARVTMLAIFRVLGDESPITRRYRSLLATALF
jgi:putative thioredoxin